MLTQSLAFLLIDRAEGRSSDEIRQMVDAYAPLPLVGILAERNEDEVARLGTAGMVMAFTVEEATAGFLHSLAISFDRTTANLAQIGAAAAQDAVVKDRKRTARDLHDQVIQQLFCLGMDIERLLAPNPELRDDARMLARRLDDAIDDLRHAVGTLRTGTTPLLGQRLKRIADDARELSGRPVDCEVVGAVDRLQSDVQATLIAVVREAVSNAVKHGEGPIDVSVIVDHNVCLEVRSGTPDPRTDDRDEPARPTELEFRSRDGGFGLTSMNNRAIAAGGESELTTLADGSTVLRWSIPLNRERGTNVPAA